RGRYRSPQNCNPRHEINKNKTVGQTVRRVKKNLRAGQNRFENDSKWITKHIIMETSPLFCAAQASKKYQPIPLSRAIRFHLKLKGGQPVAVRYFFGTNIS